MMRKIIYQNEFLEIDYDIRRMLFNFCRCVEMDLVDEDFDHFWFEIKLVDNNILLLYLLYRNTEDERILTWHIYLQERLGKFVRESGVDLGDLKIAIIVECENLWNEG